MQNFKTSLLASAAALVLLVACKSSDKKKEDAATKPPQLKEETVTYKVDSLTMTSFVAYDENKTGKRPGILVIHEWWGLNDYVKMRVRKLAELGYIAMAVDMYGNNQMGPDPKTAEKLSMPFYINPIMAKKHFDAAMDNFKKNSITDTTKLAAMGYCFGGGMSLGMAMLGADLDGAICFHGNLNVAPVKKDLLKAEVLVLHGNADAFVPQAEIDQFKKQMDSIGAKYTFIGYDSATHAFTNPEATAIGEKYGLPIKYNAKADSASWTEMKSFFERIFK